MSIVISLRCQVFLIPLLLLPTPSHCILIYRHLFFGLSNLFRTITSSSPPAWNARGTQQCSCGWARKEVKGWVGLSPFSILVLSLSWRTTTPTTVPYCPTALYYRRNLSFWTGKLTMGRTCVSRPYLIEKFRTGDCDFSRKWRILVLTRSLVFQTRFPLTITSFRKILRQNFRFI